MPSGQLNSLLSGLTAIWRIGKTRVDPYRRYSTLHKHKHLALKAQAELPFISVALHPINLPDIWHEAARCQGRRRWWGRDERHWIGSLVTSLWVIIQHEYTERKALFKFERPSCFLYLRPWSLPPSLTLLLHLTCMWGEHTGGRGKTIMLGSHKSTGCNSQAIHY